MANELDDVGSPGVFGLTSPQDGIGDYETSGRAARDAQSNGGFLSEFFGSNFFSPEKLAATGINIGLGFTPAGLAFTAANALAKGANFLFGDGSVKSADIPSFGTAAVEMAKAIARGDITPDRSTDQQKVERSSRSESREPVSASSYQGGNQIYTYNDLFATPANPIFQPPSSPSTGSSSIQQPRAEKDSLLPNPRTIDPSRPAWLR